MGCDCGCGGTCPLCSRILERGMAHRSGEILYAARILDEKTTKKKVKKEKKVVRSENGLYKPPYGRHEKSSVFYLFNTARYASDGT